MRPNVQSHRVGYPLVALAAGVVAWWSVVAVGVVPQYLLPSPVAVLDRLQEAPRLYARNAWFTLRRVLLGGATGVATGFVIGLVVAVVPFLRRAVYPYLVTARVLPKIALAPLLLIYLGTGTITGLVFVSLITFFPMVVSTAAGLRETPDPYCDLAASVRAGPAATLLRVRLPQAMPDVFSGLKQSAALAVVGAVVAEWVVTTRGLGALLLLALENVQPAVMFAALLVLFAEGLAVYGAVSAVERRVLWTVVDEH